MQLTRNPPWYTEIVEMETLFKKRKNTRWVWNKAAEQQYVNLGSDATHADISDARHCQRVLHRLS